jgi:hypothetical protein
MTTNAYITWALVRAGLLRSRQKDKEINSLVSRATDDSDPASKDPYIIALAALSLYDATEPSNDQLEIAAKLADNLVGMQDENDGSLRRGAVDTITRSRGDALEIESTALGVLVWLHNSKKFAANARLAIDFLASKCKNGRFASTQATALSLMAIVEFDKVYSKPIPRGRIELTIDNELIETRQIGQTKVPKAEPSAADESKNCKGGSVWNECGSACLRTCDTPEPQACTSNCVARCQCPQAKPILNSEGVCVSECTKRGIEGPDEEGVLNFSSEKILTALGGGSLKTQRNFGLKLILDDKNEEVPSIPYSLAFKYSVLTPTRGVKRTDPNLLELSVNLEKPEVDPVEGDVVTIRVKLNNVAKEKGEAVPVPMVVAVIGIPGGFEPRVDQLQELKKSNLVDFVESKPGQVILYWRALKSQATLDIPIQALANVPGNYDSPASRAYLFYSDEDKVWAKGFSVKIQPQSGQGKENLFW